MGLKYICDSCGKTFDPDEYARLETLYTCDDRGNKVLVPERKCDICGKHIRSWRF